MDMESEMNDKISNLNLSLPTDNEATTDSEKPKISYVALITMALKTREDGRMTVSEIYKYFEENFTFFRNNDKKGWQNSVRHNLSLNDCFIKIPRDGISSSIEKKGNYWALAIGYEDMFSDGNYKRRRRMRRPVKPYADINPFELLQKQNYYESIARGQPTQDNYYMNVVMNPIPPPPYSLHNFHSQSAFNHSNYSYTNVTSSHADSLCFSVIPQPGTKTDSQNSNYYPLSTVAQSVGFNFEPKNDGKFENSYFPSTTLTI